MFKVNTSQVILRQGLTLLLLISLSGYASKLHARSSLIPETDEVRVCEMVYTIKQSVVSCTQLTSDVKHASAQQYSQCAKVICGFNTYFDREDTYVCNYDDMAQRHDTMLPLVNQSIIDFYEQVGGRVEAWVKNLWDEKCEPHMHVPH